MIIREVRDNEAEAFDRAVVSPMQAWEWGEFRKEMGSEVIRLARFDGKTLVSGCQLYSTIFPRTDKSVWLWLRGEMPDLSLLEVVKDVTSAKNGIFVKIEPEVAGSAGPATDEGHKTVAKFLIDNGCLVGKPFFATHTFWIDLTKEKDELFSGMKEKSRYNIRLSQKNGVLVTEEKDDAAFLKHMDLMLGTTKRQGFKAHSNEYHFKMWNRLKNGSGDGLKAFLLQAKFKDEVLASWMLFRFHDSLYYPYGASSEKHRELMASSALMWGAIEFGKKLGLSRLDLWGAAAPGYSRTDPWAGFTKFKEGFGGELVSYLGSFDLVIDKNWYRIYLAAEKLRGVARKLRIPM